MDPLMFRAMNNMGNILKVVENMSKTSMRLAQLCEKNGIPIDGETVALMKECKGLLDGMNLKTA